MLHLLYPSICLHCTHSLDHTHGHFCSHCLNELEVVDPRYRCLFCFTHLESLHQRLCLHCQKKRHSLHRQAAVFEPSGPALTLLQNMRRAGSAYLIKGISAFLATQFIHLSWPKPDYILPTPLPLGQKMRQGFNHHTLMAKYLSRILTVPIAKHERLCDRTVLIISDLLYPHSPLEEYAHKLLDEYPKYLYGLSLLISPNTIEG